MRKSLFLLFFFIVALSPRAWGGEIVGIPLFNTGDQWEIKVVSGVKGLARSGFCYEVYADYLIKKEGEMKVYVDGGKKEIECPQIVGRLLGVGEVDILRIPFPIKLGEKKTFKANQHPWQKVTVELTEQKNISFADKELTVYTIRRTIESPQRNAPSIEDSLLYSPTCKCVLVFSRKLTNTQTDVAITVEQVVTKFVVASPEAQK